MKTLVYGSNRLSYQALRLVRLTYWPVVLLLIAFVGALGVRIVFVPSTSALILWMIDGVALLGMLLLIRFDMTIKSRLNYIKQHHEYFALLKEVRQRISELSTTRSKHRSGRYSCWTIIDSEYDRFDTHVGLFGVDYYCELTLPDERLDRIEDFQNQFLGIAVAYRFSAFALFMIKEITVQGEDETVQYSRPDDQSPFNIRSSLRRIIRPELIAMPLRYATVEDFVEILSLLKKKQSELAD